MGTLVHYGVEVLRMRFPMLQHQREERRPPRPCNLSRPGCSKLGTTAG